MNRQMDLGSESILADPRAASLKMHMRQESLLAKQRAAQDGTVSTNLALVAANVVCFVFFQCAFFYLVGSRLFEKVLHDKGSILRNVLGAAAAEERAHFCAYVKKNAGSVDPSVAHKRDRHNRALLLRISLPIIAVSLVVMAVCMVLAIRRGAWTRSHSMSLCIILLCFLTEIYLYLVVIRNYDIVGDLELLGKLFSK